MIARLLLSFGLHRKTKRLSEAADEMHLLRMAEEILGEDVWEQAEEIEKFVAQAGVVLDTSHVERNAVLNQTNQVCLALERKRDELITNSEILIAERDQVGEKIHLLDEKITKIEAAIAEDRKKLREEASSAYQNIGKANRDMSKLTAEVGLIELEMKDHHCEIGRYVSNHAGTDAICTKICKDHAHLVAQMQSLRSSIALNHKLAAMAGV